MLSLQRVIFRLSVGVELVGSFWGLLTITDTRPQSSSFIASVLATCLLKPLREK